MVDILKYYARCNYEINKNMTENIENSEKKLYDVPVNGYFKSIGEILEHIVITDTIWLKAFKQVRNSSIFERSVLIKDRKWGERQFDDIIGFKESRNELDKLIIQYLDEINVEDMNKVIVRTTKNGDKIEKIFWKSLIHFFNHQTHHRGQISEILDELKIGNDYSNMIRID
jgi:uncharacterized damage-inducible protein DinB